VLSVERLAASQAALCRCLHSSWTSLPSAHYSSFILERSRLQVWAPIPDILTEACRCFSLPSNSLLNDPTMGWTAEGSDSSLGRFKKRLLTSPRPVLGPTQPLIQWVEGALSAGIKWPGCEADHSPPSSAEVKKPWMCTSTLPYVFMA
jgi:hypothetical protein